MTHGYLEKMLDMLTNAYNRRDLVNVQKGRPLETNIGKLFSLFAYCLELVHDNAALVKSRDDLDNAEGSVLDRYGETYGVERGAASDALYRIFIRVKWMAQLSGGDRNTIIEAAAELLGVEYTDIRYKDVFPAKIALYVDESLLSDERLELIEQIAYAIKRILAAGVGFRLYMRTYRTYRYDLPIGRGAAVSVTLWPLPRWAGPVRTAGCNGQSRRLHLKRFDYSPVSEDKTYRDQLAVAHGAYIPQTLMGAPPDVEPIMVKTRQMSVRGAAYHTHLKPKRID